MKPDEAINAIDSILQQKTVSVSRLKSAVYPLLNDYERVKRQLHKQRKRNEGLRKENKDLHRKLKNQRKEIARLRGD